MRNALFAAILLGACASAPSAVLPTADPVIAAERAFAADAARRGWAAAFRSYAAADAITLSPDPVNAHEQLATFPGDGQTTLDWRPAYAGIAQSGDFGFTTGPFQFRGREGIVGHYFTVWRRQPDGAWKWIFDAGTDVRDPGPAVAVDAQIPTLPVALERADSAGDAVEEVTVLEARYSRPGELANQLTPDAHVNRPFEAAAIGRTAAVSLMTRDGEASYRPISREGASSGDMVFSLGEIRDQYEGAERLRYYARIWQRRPEGWRIVFDEIVPRRAG